MHSMLARAAYAAAAAEVFPVEAQITAFDPSSAAFDTAIVIPRSLKEPVGFSPSYLRYTSHPRPTRALSLGEWISGVDPSFSEMTGVASVTGRKSRYRAITPRSWRVERIMRNAPLGSCGVLAAPAAASRSVPARISFGRWWLDESSAPEVQCSPRPRTQAAGSMKCRFDSPRALPRSARSLPADPPPS